MAVGNGGLRGWDMERLIGTLAVVLWTMAAFLLLHEPPPTLGAVVFAVDSGAGWVVNDVAHWALDLTILFLVARINNRQGVQDAAGDR